MIRKGARRSGTAVTVQIRYMPLEFAELSHSSHCELEHRQRDLHRTDKGYVSVLSLVYRDSLGSVADMGKVCDSDFKPHAMDAIPNDSRSNYSSLCAVPCCSSSLVLQSISDTSWPRILAQCRSSLDRYPYHIAASPSNTCEQWAKSVAR